MLNDKPILFCISYDILCKVFLSSPHLRHQQHKHNERLKKKEKTQVHTCLQVFERFIMLKSKEVNISNQSLSGISFTETKCKNVAYLMNMLKRSFYLFLNIHSTKILCVCSRPLPLK